MNNNRQHLFQTAETTNINQKARFQFIMKFLIGAMTFGAAAAVLRMSAGEPQSPNVQVGVIVNVDKKPAATPRNLVNPVVGPHDKVSSSAPQGDDGVLDVGSVDHVVNSIVNDVEKFGDKIVKSLDGDTKPAEINVKNRNLVNEAFCQNLTNPDQCVCGHPETSHPKGYCCGTAIGKFTKCVNTCVGQDCCNCAEYMATNDFMTNCIGGAELISPPCKHLLTCWCSRSSQFRPLCHNDVRVVETPGVAGLTDVLYDYQSNLTKWFPQSQCKN